MATIGNTNLTLSDWKQRLDPDGSVAAILELLMQENAILDQMVMVEGNKPDGHKTTVRTGLPDVTWRKLNYGVAASKSSTVQVTEAIGMLEAWGKVDKDLAEMNGNTAQFRLGENQAFLQALNHEVSTTLFYGNTDVNPERFMGLAPRFSDGRAANAENAENILNGGGSSNCTSIWLVGWGDVTCHGIFPKGKVSGFQHSDEGIDRVEDGNGGFYKAYLDHYKWDLGLALRDWRYVVRIANIDVTALKADASSGADLVHLMGDALETIQGITSNAAFYCNRTIRKYLRQQFRTAKNVQLPLEMAGGKRVAYFDEVPVHRCDAILNTESAVPFA